jgi:hypothetical protein
MCTFIDDVYLVFAFLGGKSYLVNKFPDILHAVITCSIQFMDIQGCAFVKCSAAMAFITCFTIGLEVFAINGFGENSGTGGFSNTSWPAKKKGMGKSILPDSIF